MSWKKIEKKISRFIGRGEEGGSIEIIIGSRKIDKIVEDRDSSVPEGNLVFKKRNK